MTTSVTVSVAGHEVLVVEKEVIQGEQGHSVNERETLMSETHETRTFYVHGKNSLTISETGKYSNAPKAVEEPEAAGEDLDD